MSHFLCNRSWYFYQFQFPEYWIYVGNSADISQFLWTWYFFGSLFCVFTSQRHTAPGQTFAVFPAIYPEFSGQFAVSSGFQRIMERKSGCSIKRIILKYNDRLPEVLFCAGCFYIFYCIFHLIVHHNFMSNNVESFRFITYNTTINSSSLQVSSFFQPLHNTRK